MRICLFTPNFLPAVGGAELAADQVASGLCQRGHEITVLTCTGQGRMPPRAYNVAYYRRPPKQNLWPELLVRPLRQLHRRWPFDVVLSIYGYPTGYAAVRAREKLNIPVVIVPQGGDLYPTFHELKKRRVASVIRHAYQNADRVISISRWITARIEEVARKPLPPIDLVPNGLDLARHDADLAAASEQIDKPLVARPFILHLGRVAPVKRQTLAVEAVARLRERFERENLTYAIVGDGSAMDEVRRLIHKHRLESIVQTLGTRVGIEKAWLMANAAFAVSTSREEGWSIAVVEMMASGLPMLASDIDPHQQAIGEYGWGRLFRSGDVDDLTRQLDTMLDADLQPMREKALAQRAALGLNQMVDGYEQACQTAIAQRQNASAQAPT